MLLMDHQGSAVSVCGDDIGSEQVPIPAERVQDPFEKLVKGFDLGLNISGKPRLWQWQGYGLKLLFTGLDRGPKKVEGPIHFEAERRCSRQSNSLGPTRPSSGIKVSVVRKRG